MTDNAHSHHRRDHARRWPIAPWFASAAVALAFVAGCASDTGPRQVTAPPPGPTFVGEKYLYGTVGSMTNLRAFEPVLVSGYGLVVMPAGSGTGSSDVPTYLRQWMLNEMRKKGLGSPQFGAEDLSPRRVLESKDTAVVRVEGLMPPGATAGTPFPILVTAVENTQTTSLENGMLWTADLAIGPIDQSMQFRRPVAEAKGAVFINPFDDKVTEKERLAYQRQAVVLAGGLVKKDRPIELTLNQPSWVNARLIADRINERYPHEKATEFFNTAVAKTDMLIRVNVPSRFSGDPTKLLRLISKTYLRRGDNYEVQQARALGDYLVTKPDQAKEICEAWQALGKLALPVLREYYQHEKLHVRMAALEAGAWLQDEVVVGELQKLSLDPSVDGRIKAAELLGKLARSGRAARMLASMTDDPENRVRIAAYESLVAIGDPTVHRTVVGDEQSFKFFLDVVKSRSPLIYVSQRDIPRLVIFSPDTGFAESVRTSLWDGRFRLRGGESSDQAMAVFYQPINDVKGQTAQIAPTVANLALVMGHRTSAERPFPGFDLSYGTVVNVLYNLQKQGVVLSEMQVARNPLADAVDVFRKRGQQQDVRPESGGADELTPAAGVVPPRQPQPVSIDEDGAAPTDIRQVPKENGATPSDPAKVRAEK